MNKIKYKKIIKYAPHIMIIYILFIVTTNILNAFHINIIDILGKRDVEFNLYYTYENHDSGYYLYTDKGEFINRDSFFRMKYNSRRIHNYLLTKFKFNQKNYDVNVLTCKAQVSGYRIYFPTAYPNILSINCD